MKIQIQMKDPDGPYEAIREAVKTELNPMVQSGELTEDEADSLIERRGSELSQKCSKWLKYGEYLTVEIDTDAGTAVVLPAQ